MILKTAVLSDIHGNISALNAVVENAEDAGAIEFWCLGDVVGYGPFPYQVWDMLTTLDIDPHGWLSGNHEWGLLERIRRDDFEFNGVKGFVGLFSHLAWPILDLQRESIRHIDEMWTHIDRLPVMTSPREGVYLAHGVFADDPIKSVTRIDRSPSITHRTETALVDQLWINVNYSSKGGGPPTLYFVGHTHFPGIWIGSSFSNDIRWRKHTDNQIQFNGRPDAVFGKPSDIIYVNPGSVGFPRDGNGCASYALIDWKNTTIEIRRVGYDQGHLIDTMRSIPAYRILLENNYVPKCSENGGVNDVKLI